MKLVITKFLFLMTTRLFAKEIVYFDYQNSLMTLTKIRNGYINESCFEKKCMAMNVIDKKISIKKLNIEGGRNPGAVACKTIHQGKIIMLKRIETNQLSSFCLFNDGSYISTGIINSSITN